MFVTIVTVYVKPEYVSAFIEASRLNHEGSVKEPGNVRFDVLQCVSEPSRFLLYEAYESAEAEAAASHKTTAHYLKWRETVEPFMAKPREGVAYDSIWPPDNDTK